MSDSIGIFGFITENIVDSTSIIVVNISLSWTREFPFVFNLGNGVETKYSRVLVMGKRVKYEVILLVWSGFLIIFTMIVV